jgi:acyl carrier protein
MCLCKRGKAVNIIKGGYNTIMENIGEKVISITAEQLGIDEDKVTLESSFREDLEADSLDLVELIMTFEEEFGSDISDEDAQQIQTVGQAVEYITNAQS